MANKNKGKKEVKKKKTLRITVAKPKLTIPRYTA